MPIVKKLAYLKCERGKNPTQFLAITRDLTVLTDTAWGLIALFTCPYVKKRVASNVPVVG